MAWITTSRSAVALVCLAAMAVSAGCAKKKPSTINASAPGSEDGTFLADLRGSLTVSPDEFSVLPRRPLEIPDSVAQLPPPTPGARSSRLPNPFEDARAALQGTSSAPQPASTLGSATATAPSSVETAALSSVGTIDPNIRTAVATDQVKVDDAEKLYVLDRVFPILKTLRDTPESAEALDPVAERERLLQEGILRQPGVAAPQVDAPQTPATQVAAPQVVTPTASVPAAPSVPAQPSVRETSGGLIYIQ